MSPCTPFCNAINSLPLHVSSTPTREALIEHLPPTEGVRQWFLGTWSEVSQRNNCVLCKLVVAAITESLGQNEGSVVDHQQPIDVLLLPEEVSFRLTFPSPVSVRIAFVGSKANSTHNPDTARLLRCEGVDIARVKAWLQACDEKHPSCAGNANSTDSNTPKDDRAQNAPSINRYCQEAMTSNFRVVDIECGYIKRVPLDTKYVALSYVWGQLPMLQLRTDNFERLTREGALESIRDELPRTITDAIDLLKALGLRYLWVDGLCLIQDNAHDVSHGVSRMNTIYQGSYLTIVAAAGQDATIGLPGLRQGSECLKERQQTVVQLSSGLRLTINHSIDWHLRRSVHNQRGWTLQELVLPNRTIIFINGQVYFRCREASWSEETWADQHTHWLDADDSNISRLPDPAEGFLPSCWAYQKICEEFSRRILRNDGDALRALQGILRPTAAGMRTKIVEGLPGYYLDHFLLFVSSTGAMRRRSLFASFSWAGWEGPKMWPRENFEWPRVTAEGKSTDERATDNILRFFDHNRVVDWTSVRFDSYVDQLTPYAHDAPSLVLRIMQEHPTVFGNLMEDPVHLSLKRTFSQYESSCSYRDSDIPSWVCQSCGSTKVEPSAPHHRCHGLPSVCMTAVEPFHGQAGMSIPTDLAELRQLIYRFSKDVNAQRTMQNWLAQQRFRANLLQLRLGLRDGTELRQPSQRNDSLSDADRDSSSAIPLTYTEDRRGSRYKAWSRETAAGVAIPVFPPYTVLSFATISLFLALATPSLQSTTTDTSPFARITGISLLGNSGRLLGCLHPDNVSVLPNAGSVAELLIIARCHKPTTGSTLLDIYHEGKEQPMKLFWVLYVVWQDGIAERRGVGQVLEEALEDGVGVPEAKSVLLG